MKEWEKELQIYRLIPAPPKENDLQKYILYYLSEKDDKYLAWFFHYYERTVNDKAMAFVQDYAMFGHFSDIKQAYIIGLLKALQDYDPSRGVPFVVYKEYAAMHEVHEYIRTGRARRYSCLSSGTLAYRAVPFGTALPNSIPPCLRVNFQG